MATAPKKSARASANPRAAIQVVSRPHSFCRAGRCFTQEPTVIALDELSDEQEAALRAEAMLVVTDTELPAAEADAKKDS